MKKLSLNSKSANTQTFYNFLSTLIRTGINFITMPIFTRLLGTEGYGLFSLYYSWYSILTCFSGLNLGCALATGMYKYKNDYLKFRSSLLFSGMFINLIGIIFACLLYIPLSNQIPYSFPIYMLLFIEASFSFVTGFANGAWTYEKKAKNNMIMSISNLMLSTILSILFLYFWQGNSNNLYIGRVLGVAIPEIAIGIIVWIYIFKEKKYGFNKEYLKYGLSFGFPIIFHSLSHQILGSSDKIMMQYFGIANSEIGIYSFFYSFTAILTTILSALNNSWVPFLYDDLDKKEYTVLNTRVKNYVQIFTVLTCGFLLVSKEVTKYFANSDYWQGMPIIPILVLVSYSTFIYQFSVNYELFKEKANIVAIGTIISACENILLNAILIPPYGMYGAAIATLISYATLAIIHTVVVRRWKYEKYPLTLKYELIGLLLVCIACAMYYLLGDMMLIRWIIALSLGIYLIYSVMKRHTIF